jgi:hypothetical protein
VATVLQANQTTTLQPGDVVEIKKLLRRGVSQPNASATQASLLPCQMGAAGAEKQVGSTSQIATGASDSRPRRGWPAELPDRVSVDFATQIRPRVPNGFQAQGILYHPVDGYIMMDIL